MTDTKTQRTHSLALAAVALALGATATAQENYAVINGEPLTKGFVDLVAPEGLPTEQLRPMVEVMARNIVVAQEAEKSDLAGSDELKAELEIARLQVLVRAYVRDFLEANQVTDEQVEAEYEDFKAQAAGQGGFEYNASHILVETEDDAVAIIAEVGGDADKFAEIATERSADPGSGANGGNLGWSQAQAYVPEFAAALEGMEPGEFTAEPVETQFGWHVIHLVDRRETQFPPLEGELRQQIVERLQSELIEKEFDRLVATAEIEYSDSLGEN